jgi:hypothetical protein
MKLILFLFRYIHAAFACLYVFTIGLFSSRNRNLIFTISGHFAGPFRNMLRVNLPILPAIDLSTIVGKTEPLKVLEPDQRDGNVSYLEILTINSIVAFYRPVKIFEIGTFDGRTSLNMAANAPADSVVYTLDLPAAEMESTAFPVDFFDRSYINKEVSGSRIAGQNCAQKIVQLSGDSGAFDFSPYMGKINFVFVDGAHTFEYAMNDSEIARRLLGGNEGIILWHDYGNCEGVTKALNQLYSKGNFWSGIRWIQGTCLACLVVGARQYNRS